MLNIIKNNRNYLFKKSIRVAFGISTVASIYEIAIGRIMDKDTTLLKAIVVLLLIFVGLYILSFLAISLWLIFKNNIEVFSTDKHSVYLHFGDIFDNEIVNNESIPKHIVINVNRCFDTIVNNELISEKTLHGMVFKNLYNENKFTEETLQKAINEKLKDLNYSVIQKEDKPQGNLKRYDIGTIVKIDETKRKDYFLLAMSTFDNNLNAHTTKQDFVLALQRLIEYCDRNSQGFPVLMPLLGSGLSRTRLNSFSDILRFIINTLRLNKDIINCDFHIYLRPQDKQKINFGNL